MKRISLLFLIVICGVAFYACENTEVQQLNIVPRPVEVQVTKGHFLLTPQTVIQVEKGEENIVPACRFFADYVGRSFGSPLKIEEGGRARNAIHVAIDTTLGQEAYQLTVNKKKIDILAGSGVAVFYAFQTLRQMTPVAMEKGEKMTVAEIQNAVIKDEPRFAYRGAMLDVGRHLFTVEDIKTFIDMLALHKLNRFHWHLTDDQGWRIEIKKYPELTKVGSMRKETVIGRNSGKYDGQPYGGYYSQEEVKEIVKYAADRYITVIPEIELPGHAGAALASYPWLGCTGGPYEVVKEWGVFEDVYCAGSEKTFQFFEDVFDEVISLFPSEFIHVGGDECPKEAWKKCPKCQRRIKKENLKNEYELQSYFVHRMEKYLNSKGRKIIGWDEILEGGISKTATIMSWRGTRGGIEAAKQGNQVIMAPNTYVYLDYYQALDREKEPFAIGGYLPIEKVYSLEPTLGLNPEESKMVIGVQANTWTEYIKDFKHVQYMVLPRLAALSEVAWTPASEKDYASFINRIVALSGRYDALGYNYAKHILSVIGTTKLNREKKELELTLAPTGGKYEIHYTLDGNKPTLESPLYKDKLKIRENCSVKALLFREGEPLGKEYQKDFTFSKSAFKKVTLSSQLALTYSAQGGMSLTDGVRGSEDFQDGNWLGTSIDDIVLVIDMEQPTTYTKVSVSCLNRPSDRICLPESIKVYQSNGDQYYFKVAELKNIDSLKDMQTKGIKKLDIEVEKGEGRFIKVVVERKKRLPEGHPASGAAPYLFVDEVEVN